MIDEVGEQLELLCREVDQLAVDHDSVTGDEIAERFRNRPDEPVWMYGDAVSRGDVGGALRRLEDFLQHEHPLVLLAYLNNDLRRRALAAASPDSPEKIPANFSISCDSGRNCASSVPAVLRADTQIASK